MVPPRPRRPRAGPEPRFHYRHDPNVYEPTREVRRLGVVAFKGNAAPAMDILFRWAEAHPGIHLAVNAYLKAYRTRSIPVRDDAYLRSRTDLLLSVGGDGTFLSCARILRGAATPILGVNLGRVGFLADVTLENLAAVLDQILRREYSVRRRMLLTAKVYRRGKKVAEDLALNEVAIAGSMGGQMVDLRVSTQGRFLTDYWVDGLLIATPTGSTAYSLSAGGPIIHPTADSLLLTPLNPSSLSVRPLVLPDSHIVLVQSQMPPERKVRVIVDGHTMHDLDAGDRLYVQKSAQYVSILRPKDASYFESLRNKLGWAGSPHSRGAG